MSVNQVTGKHHRAGVLAVLLLLGGLLGKTHAAPVAIPFSEDFQSAAVLGDLPDFTFAPSGNWSIVSGGAQFSTSTVPQINAAAVQVTPAISTPTTVSTTFHVASATSGGSDVGLAIFGSTVNFNTGSSHYLLDLKPGANNMRILKVSSWSSSLSDIVAPTAIPAFVVGDTYRLTAEATPVGGGLDLSLTLQNLTTMAAATTISGHDPSPLTGTYFALRSRSSAAGTLSVNYHDFSIVPEPSSFGLAAIAMWGCLAARRLRRREVNQK